MLELQNVVLITGNSFQTLPNQVFGKITLALPQNLETLKYLKVIKS
jgi:hypothetical protein